MLVQLTKRPSAKVLILANLLPLFGVTFWGWSTFSIVVLYWMENLVLGGINILKMVTCRPEISEEQAEEYFLERLPAEKREETMAELEKHGGVQAAMTGSAMGKGFMIPFFTFHYFFFCAIHGVFVFVMFGRDSSMGSGLFGAFEGIPDLLTGSFALAAIGLVASHLYSFFTNYLGRGEFKKTVVPLLMFQPYGRIVVLHVAIIFGGVVVTALGSPVVLLIVLVAGKIVIDLKMHDREHSKADGPKTGSPIMSAIMSKWQR